MGHVVVKYKVTIDQPDEGSPDYEGIANTISSMEEVQACEIKPLAFGMMFIEVQAVLGEGEEASEGHHGEGGEGGAEVAPAAIDAFSQADFLGREPLGHHADADHEAGANDGEQQTGHHQLVEVLSGGKQQAGNRREHQDRGVGDPGSEFVQEHADQHARRNGEGHVADGHSADLTNGQTQVRFHGGGQRGQVEPDHEGQEEGDPGQVKGSVPALERPKVAKH